jgi:hypothetical protein
MHMQMCIQTHVYFKLHGLLTLECKVGEVLTLFIMGELLEEWDLTMERLSMSSASPAWYIGSANETRRT